MIQYRRFHCIFICRAELDVREATFRIRQLSQRSWQCLKTFNDEEPQKLKSYRNSFSVQITLKTRLCWSVQSRRVTFISLWLVHGQVKMSTAKKNLCLYIVDCVRVISISRPMERCSRTSNSAARLVATNCKKVGPKCSADDNAKYWHKCPKNKTTIVYLNIFHPHYMDSDRSRDEAENRRKSKAKFCKRWVGDSIA